MVSDIRIFQLAIGQTIYCVISVVLNFLLTRILVTRTGGSD